MFSKSPRRNTAAGKSTASIPATLARKEAGTTNPSCKVETYESDNKTSALFKDFSILNLQKQDQVLSTQEPSDGPALTCAVCARIGHVLTCCKDLTIAHNCEDCTAIGLLFAKETPDPQHERQVKEDRIESLKLETKQFDAENERLKGVLAQKKKLLQEKRDELYKKKPEGPKILKRLGRAKAAKRKKENV